MKKTHRNTSVRKLTLNSETIKYISGGGVRGTTRGTFPTVGNTTPNTGTGSTNCPESQTCPTEGCPG
jgi:hypothetical protein